MGMTILRAASKMPFSLSTGVGRAAFRASSAQKGSEEDDLIPEKKIKKIKGAYLRTTVFAGGRFSGGLQKA